MPRSAPPAPFPGRSAHDEAVSPVIGVILMVAITVVLGAVVFVMARQMAQTNDQAPTVQFLRDDTNGQLLIIQAFRPVDLTLLEVQTSDDTHFVFDGEADSGDTPAAAGQFTAFAATPGTILEAGRALDFCRDGGPGKTDFAVRVMDPKPILVYRNTFTNLRGCA